MSEIRCVGPLPLVGAAVNLLQDEGCVHIESAPTGRGGIALERLTPDETVERQRGELDRRHAQIVRALLLLPEVNVADRARAERTSPALDPSDAGAIRRLSSVGRRLDQLARRRKRVEDEQALLSRYGYVLSALAPLLVDIPASRELEYLGVTLQRRDPDTIRRVRQALARLTESRYELLLAEPLGDLTAGVLVVPTRLAPAVRAALGEQGIGEMPMPAAIAGKPWREAIAILMRRQLRLPVTLVRLDRALAALSRRHRAWLAALRLAVENRLAQLDAMTWCAQTAMTFVIEGWMPRRDLAPLRERLRLAFGGRVVLEAFDAPHAAREAPVALTNPRWMQPFELLVSGFSLPKYGTIDPTPLVAVGFPLFFGMIVGDVVYGAIVLGVGLWLRRRFAGNRIVASAARIGLLASVWTIVFGVLYGEYGGTLGERIGLKPILVDRLHGLTWMLGATVGVGALHVTLGIVLGISHAARAGMWRAVASKLGGLFLVVGALTAAARAAAWLPGWAIWPAVASIAIGIVAIVASREARAFLELHNVVNVLSYLRLMGIGVASAALAFAANLLGEMTGHLVLGVMVGVLLHLVNILFAIVSPTIQVLRLHYVEFFENFFEPGGRPYQPFRRVGKSPLAPL